jgi:hypothetical protein
LIFWAPRRYVPGSLLLGPIGEALHIAGAVFGFLCNLHDNEKDGCFYYFFPVLFAGIFPMSLHRSGFSYHHQA